LKGMTGRHTHTFRKTTFYVIKGLSNLKLQIVIRKIITVTDV